MTAQTIYTLWLRDMKWFIRSKSRLISTFVMPFFWLAILGVALGSMIPTVPGVSGEVNYLNFMAPGIIGMMILFSSTMSGVSVIWDKQFGFMKEILVAPASRVHIMLGKAFGGATTSVLQGLILLLVAGLIGVTLPGVAGFAQALLFAVLMALGFVGMGLVFASRIEDPHAFPIVINFIIMPIFFLSGAIYPINLVPGWLRAVAYVNPMTYGVDGLRASIVGIYDFPIWLDLVILGTFSLAMIILGGYLFNKMKA